jgi:calcineurin-like phosphoesterase
MCGDYASIIGFAREEPMRRLIEKTPGSRWRAAEGEGSLAGILVETEDATGLARSIEPLRLGPGLPEAMPRRGMDAR